MSPQHCLLSQNCRLTICSLREHIQVWRIVSMFIQQFTEFFSCSLWSYNIILQIVKYELCMQACEYNLH